MKKPGCPTFGNLVGFRSLQHEPLNEQGVVFVFGMVAEELGFRVKLVRNEFPDCIADQRIGNGRWQEVKIEFEFESRTFAEHGHDLDGCDLIVCWRDNWQDKPERLQVLELERHVSDIQPARRSRHRSSRGARR